MTKKIDFRRPARSPEDWVAAGVESAQVPLPLEALGEATAISMKRLTIDLPAHLHRRVKRGCADREMKMADIVRDLLEREFPS